MSATQQRCVFVGNIPYDATEEQLIEICKEVGPVVSFRLVVDRETGKPKGYGFCEYRDEETAASARRNLQGYEVNGRQLRVDYAENAKGVDRNREQDRGGPGLASNFDSQKYSGGAATTGDPSINPPIGLSAAAMAASNMAGVLGGPQTAIMSQGQSNIGGPDPLTLHLASMSKNQLYEILYEMKALAQQNQQQARQILVSYPQFSKALFQIEIMLGLVPPNMLSKLRQSSNTPPQQASQTVQPDSGIHSGQQDQMHSRQNQIQPGQQTQTQLGQNCQMQLLQQIPGQNIPMGQPPIQNLQQSQTQVSQPLLQSIQPVSQNLHVPVQPPMQPQTTMIQPHVPPAVSSQSQQSSMQPTLGNINSPPLPQQPRPSLQSHQPSSQLQSQQTQMTFKSSNSLHQQQSRLPFQHLGSHLQSATVIPFQKHTQPPLPNLPSLQQSYQVGSVNASVTVSSVESDAVGQSSGLHTLGTDGAVQEGGGPNSLKYLIPRGNDVSWAQVPLSTGGLHIPAVSSGMAEPVVMSRDLTSCLNSSPSHPIIEDGSNRDYKADGGGTSGIISGSSDNVVGTSVVYSQGLSNTSVGMPQPQQPMTEVTQLPLEMQSALLQQVMNLTTEQVKCLTPDQQEQVFQLQQLLRNK